MFEANFWTEFKKLKILFVLCLCLSLQGCSVDNYVSDGNGHPYEGLTVDGDTERNPATEGEPAQDVNEGGFPMNTFVTHYLCTNPESEYLKHIRFGVQANQRPVLIVRHLDLSGYLVDWFDDQQEFPIFRSVDKDITLTSIVTERMLGPEGGTMVARYYENDRDDNRTFREIFHCRSLLEGAENSPVNEDDDDEPEDHKKR